jgi:EAL domain-containing protein (putative c-di-GMP-specific phosphodiesterase class I)
VLFEDGVYASELDQALRAGRCPVTRHASRLAEIVTLIERGDPLPEVLVTGLRLPDGDAFELMRRLTRLPQAPALFIVSRQQRAVVHAAVRAAALLGLRVVGHVEQPAEVADVAAAVLASVAAEGARDRPLAGPAGDASVSTALAAAMNDEGRIVAVLQPRVRLATGEVTGFEALMRGVARDGTLVLPDRLLAPLEEAGLLAAATLAVLRQAIVFLQDGLADALPVSVSLNVPLALMSDAVFCRRFVRMVEGAGIDPSWITLEISESDAMAELAGVIENTARIRMYGFNLSIDDFGTAAAGFTQLIQLPVSELKIDRSLVAQLDHEASARAMVGALAAMADRLGIQTVAEGVETVAQLAAARAAGCTAVQGFLLGVPMAPAEALGWLRELPGQCVAAPDLC